MASRYALYYFLFFHVSDNNCPGGHIRVASDPNVIN